MFALSALVGMHVLAFSSATDGAPNGKTPAHALVNQDVIGRFKERVFEHLPEFVSCAKALKDEKHSSTRDLELASDRLRESARLFRR